MVSKHYLFDSKNYYTLNILDDKKRHMVVIVPGGGYDHTSSLESENVANKFNELGFNTCILNYRETLDVYPYPQNLLKQTIKELRQLSNVDKIISIGFSAGGHLALYNACYCNDNQKPDLLVLCYPVISTDVTIAHIGSFNNLLGSKSLSSNMLDTLSLEKNIKPSVPPIFVWHCITDESVDVCNTLRLVKACHETSISCECHIFNEGVHGMSLSDKTTGIYDKRKENTYVARWFDMMITWLDKMLNEIKNNKFIV